MIKFIPFSFFLVVPLSEFILPAYLIVFPNSIPSQFLGDDKKTKKFKEQLAARDIAAERLTFHIPRLFKAQRENDGVT